MNEQPSNQAATVPQGTPTSGTTPNGSAIQQPATPLQPVQQAAPVTQGGRPKTGLLIGIISVFVLLIAAVLVAGWFMFWSPAAQAKRLSNSFMHSMATGDIDGALKLTNDPTAKSFLTTASEKVHGSFKMSDNKFAGGKGYYLYLLSPSTGDYKYARTIVEKDKNSGKLVVDSFVYDTTKLVLVPKESNDSTPAEPSASAAPVSTAPTLACLSQDDYKWMNYDKQPDGVTYDSTYDPSAYTLNKTEDMFFKPDSTTEDSLLSVYDDWADFAKHNSDKQWKFRLEGSTYGSDSGTAASKQLADARAQEVKTQLTNRGVPADRIIIDPPHNYAGEGQNDSMDRIYRRVQVVVDPTCDSSATATSSATGQ